MPGLFWSLIFQVTVHFHELWGPWRKYMTSDFRQTLPFKLESCLNWLGSHISGYCPFPELWGPWRNYMTSDFRQTLSFKLESFLNWLVLSYFRLLSPSWVMRLLKELYDSRFLSQVRYLGGGMIMIIYSYYTGK